MANGDGKLHLTRERVGRLQKAYGKAVEAERESFVFEGNTFSTAYAKYVLEYAANLPGIRQGG